MGGADRAGHRHGQGARTAATKVVCYRGGYGSTQTCSGTAGASSTFETGTLEPGEGMTVLLSYPLGTFTNTAPILRHTGIARVLDVSPYAVGLSGAGRAWASAG